MTTKELMQALTICCKQWEIDSTHRDFKDLNYIFIAKMAEDILKWTGKSKKKLVLAKKVFNILETAMEAAYAHEKIDYTVTSLVIGGFLDRLEARLYDAPKWLKNYNKLYHYMGKRTRAAWLQHLKYHYEVDSMEAFKKKAEIEQARRRKIPEYHVYFE